MPATSARSVVLPLLSVLFATVLAGTLGVALGQATAPRVPTNNGNAVDAPLARDYGLHNCTLSDLTDAPVQNLHVPPTKKTVIVFVVCDR